MTCTTKFARILQIDYLWIKRQNTTALQISLMKSTFTSKYFAFLLVQRSFVLLLYISSVHLERQVYESLCSGSGRDSDPNFASLACVRNEHPVYLLLLTKHIFLTHPTPSPFQSRSCVFGITRKVCHYDTKDVVSTITKVSITLCG